MIQKATGFCMVFSISDIFFHLDVGFIPCRDHLNINVPHLIIIYNNMYILAYVLGLLATAS